MEITTPFDLNSAIQLWRENLQQSPALRGENLNELESHLRDSVATLRSQKLSSEEAFIIATRRMGKEGLLEAEFAKINRQSVWLDRILWILIGFQIWIMVLAVSHAGAYFVYGVSRRLTNSNQLNERTFFMLDWLLPSLLILLFAGLGWRFLARSTNKKQRLFSLPANPIKLAVVMFTSCLGCKLVADFFCKFVTDLVVDGSVLGQNWKYLAGNYWKYLAGNSFQLLPELLACTLLIAIFARKRLSLSRV